MAPSAATDSNGPRPPRYTLAQFKSLERIGAGSFGSVVRVVNNDSAKVFAMKLLEKGLVKRKGLEGQLRREVLTQVRVKHANVVHLHYYFEDEARIYCLLEFADQGTLFFLLQRSFKDGGLAETICASLFKDTALGLAYLHDLRVAHRDLKPENILLFGSRPTAKIGDFGWCVELTDEVPLRNTFCGTLDYLSPEVLQSVPHGTGVDMWAMGVLLFELLTTKSPFAAGSQKESMERICAVKFDLPNRMPEAPEALIRGLLVHGATERLPLSSVLRNPWVLQNDGSEFGCENGKQTDENRALDPTTVVRRRAPAELDERTLTVPRRASAAIVSAPSPVAPKCGPASRILDGGPGAEDPLSGESQRLKTVSGRPSLPAWSPTSNASKNALLQSEPSSPVVAVTTKRVSGSFVMEAAQDLDERLLGAPPAPDVVQLPEVSREFSTVRRGNEIDLVKDLVVSSVPRPKARSRRT